MPEYVMTLDYGLDFLESIDGVHWAEAPLPPVDHECWPQTKGLVSGECVARCACGAISIDRPYEVKRFGRIWLERNSRHA